MTVLDRRKAAIDEFGARYDYDMSYQHRLLDDAPAAFEVFARAQGTSAHREALPLDAHYVARVAIMIGEDCGDCVLINLRMAVEEGVSRELLRQVLWRPDELSAELRDVREHAIEVATVAQPDAERAARIRAAYGDAGAAELAVCLAGCRLFTTAKRSLGKARPADVKEGEF